MSLVPTPLAAPRRVLEDASGQRLRLLRRVGRAVALVLVVWLSLVFLGGIGVGPAAHVPFGNLLRPALAPPPLRHAPRIVPPARADLVPALPAPAAAAQAPATVPARAAVTQAPTATVPARAAVTQTPTATVAKPARAKGKSASAPGRSVTTTTHGKSGAAPGRTATNTRSNKPAEPPGRTKTTKNRKKP
jgi:hypothetical protein